MLSATKNSARRQSCIGNTSDGKPLAKDKQLSPEQTRILVVDDRPENLVALKAVLESTSYNVITATSGEEALRWVLKEEFSVIILDVQMPGLDGFETARLIKNREKTRHIPIVFVTAANQASEHVQKGFEVGAVDYIFKPFSPEMLRRKVDALVRMFTSHQIVRRLVHARTAQLKAANLKLRNQVAERKRIAESFRALFEVSPCLMAILSLKEGRLIEANQSWLAHTGSRYEDVVGCTVDHIGISWNCQEEQMAPVINTLVEIKKNIPIAYITKEGEKREGLLSTEQVEYDNRLCVLMVITDITEKVRLQRELARLDRFHLVGEMAAGLAHEIRNPMTTVSGFLQLSKAQGRLSPAHIDLMLEELDRANTIIAEFLSLAKDKRVDRKLMFINEIIEALYPLIQAEAFMKSQTVTLALTDCPRIYLDEKEIRQLILNMSLNGLEAMDEGGRLEIGTSFSNGYVVLSVKDEGHGIQDDLLDKILEPFFTTKDCGTGLGLPICYSVARRHNAEIDINTSEYGTVFLVYFPWQTDNSSGSGVKTPITSEMA